MIVQELAALEWLAGIVKGRGFWNFWNCACFHATLQSSSTCGLHGNFFLLPASVKLYAQEIVSQMHAVLVLESPPIVPTRFYVILTHVKPSHFNQKRVVTIRTIYCRLLTDSLSRPTVSLFLTFPHFCLRLQRA